MSLPSPAKHANAPGRMQTTRMQSAKAGDRRAKDRKHQRLIEGYVACGSTKPRPCTICDMSAGGSKIELWNDDARPLQRGDRITLYIPGDRNEVDAEVRWRKEKAVGLRFVSAFRAPTRSYA